MSESSEDEFEENIGEHGENSGDFGDKKGMLQVWTTNLSDSLSNNL